LGGSWRRGTGPGSGPDGARTPPKALALGDFWFRAIRLCVHVALQPSIFWFHPLLCSLKYIYISSWRRTGPRSGPVRRQDEPRPWPWGVFAPRPPRVPPPASPPRPGFWTTAFSTFSFKVMDKNQKFRPIFGSQSPPVSPPRPEPPPWSFFCCFRALNLCTCRSSALIS
jgi:hypothetical protein